MPLNDDPFVLKLYCPACGQKLALPTADLRQAYRCPRCGASHAAADLVDRGRTVPAVPLTPDAIAAPPLLAEPVMAPMPVQHSPAASAIPSASPLRPTFAAHRSVAEQVPLAAPDALPPSRAAGAPIAAPPAAVFAAPAVQVPAEPMQPQSGPTSTVPGPSPFASAVLLLDAKLHRRRGLVLSLAAFAVVLGSLVDDDVYGVGVTLFVALLGLMLVAWILTLRDDSGRLTVESARRWIVGAIEGAIESTSAFFAAPGHEKARRARDVLAGVGLFILAVRPIIASIGRGAMGAGYKRSTVGGFDTLAAWAGWGMVAAAIAIWYFRSRAVATRARMTGLAITADRESAAVPEGGVRALPPVLDLTQGRRVPDGASASPLLASTLHALATWAPPRRCYYERQFQDSLVDHLYEVLPEVPLREQFAVASQHGDAGRIDIVIGETIALELKRHLYDTATSRAARAQVEDYARAWHGRGPVLLVICETQPNFATSIIGDKIRELHAAGWPVAVVAAGRRVR